MRFTNRANLSGASIRIRVKSNIPRSTTFRDGSPPGWARTSTLPGPTMSRQQRPSSKSLMTAFAKSRICILKHGWLATRRESSDSLKSCRRSRVGPSRQGCTIAVAGRSNRGACRITKSVGGTIG